MKQQAKTFYGFFLVFTAIAILPNTAHATQKDNVRSDSPIPMAPLICNFGHSSTNSPYARKKTSLKHITPSLSASSPTPAQAFMQATVVQSKKMKSTAENK